MRIVLSGLLICALTVACSATSSEQKMANKPVVVVGATGRTGQEVVKALLNDGYSVRAFVRDQAKAEERLPGNIEVVVGDVANDDQVAAAVNGARHVISTIGSMSPQGPNRPEMVDYRGVARLIDASKAAGVDQFVLVSSLGATKKDHPLNTQFGNVLIWKLKGENHLRDSGLAYTIVRPGGLASGPARQSKLVIGQGDTIETGRVPRSDVGEICVAALSEPEARGKTFEVITEDVSDDVFGP